MANFRATFLKAALAVLGTAGVAAPVVARPISAQDATTRPAAGAVALPALGLADVPTLGRILLDPAQAPAGRREQAAARLLVTQTDDSIALVVEALRPTAPGPSQAAAASAAAGVHQADPRLVESLLTLLASEAPLPVKRDAGRALAAYRPDSAVRTRLAELAVGGTTGTRRGAIAGLARMPGKSAAQALMLLLDGDADPAVERDAAEAIAAMTGLAIPPDDLAGWQRWWEQTSRLNEAEFAAELLRSRANDVQAITQRADRAVAALLEVSRARLRVQAGGDRQSLLVEMLQSPLPEMREVGAALVYEDANFADPIAPAVFDMVRAAITDPEPRVRAWAAQIVMRRPDPASLDPLLAQASREPSPATLVWQLQALGALRDGRALPLVLAQLEHASPGVRGVAGRRAAEIANAAGGPAVLQASTAIQRAYDAAAPLRRAASLRRELLAALAELRDPSLARFYLDLLANRASASNRESIIRGMGTLGEESLSDAVAAYLGDEEARVRLEAVRALGKTSRGFERAELLFQVLSREAETQAVRDAAWQTLLALFPRASVSQLSSWPDRFNSQPDRRLEVLRALAKKAEEAGDAEQLAFRRQQMADVHMQLNQSREAAPLYRLALQYSLENRGTAGTIQTRSRNVLQAHIRAREWDQVSAFAAESARRDPGFVETVGSIVKQEAAAFAETGQPDVARGLIETALRMNPPLDDRTVRQLREQLGTLPAPR